MHGGLGPEVEPEAVNLTRFSVARFPDKAADGRP